MINPHKDLVILRGWPRTEYAGRESENGICGPRVSLHQG